MSLVLFSLFPLGIDALMPFILPIISFFYLLILKIWYFDIFVCLNVVYFVLVLWLLLFLHACKTNSWFSATWTRYLGLCLRSGIWFGCLDAFFGQKDGEFCLNCCIRPLSFFFSMSLFTNISEFCCHTNYISSSAC